MKKLKKVYIEITNVCNLSCAFCPGTTRKPGFMTPADFETVLKRLRGYTDYLYFHVLGEPLLHPELSGLLDLSAFYGYKVNITTNGTKIAGRAKELLNSGALRQVNFSLHCQEEADDCAAVQKYLDDIFDFTCAALEKGGLYISYRLWNITSEASERYNAYILQKLQQRFSPGFSTSEAMQETARIKLKERLFLNSAEVFHWPAEKAVKSTGNAGGLAGEIPGSSEDQAQGVDAGRPEKTAKKSGFCLGLRDQAAILVDGSVVPCCLDSEGSIKLGNIFEDEFEYILEGERARNLYEGFSRRKTVESLCMGCGYRSRFS